MKIKLNYKSTEDFNYECVEVFKDDVRILNIGTANDCPEDNSISRMDVRSQVENLIKVIVPDVEIEKTTETI